MSDLPDMKQYIATSIVHNHHQLPLIIVHNLVTHVL